MNQTIELRNLSIGYHEKGKGIKTIAQGIQAHLCGGELTCLLGANGAGKSTLLKTLSAFLTPLEGEILVEGKALKEYTQNERAKLIGVVLTEKPELHHMTVNELVGLGRSPYTGFWGNLSKEDQGIVDEALRMVGMQEMASRQVDTLSDGERQKAMIAKALAQQTPIIFLDEPTAFLDYPSKVETMLLLRQLAHDTGKTIFLSTHDVELALQTSDTLWLMRRIRGATSERATSGDSTTQSPELLRNTPLTIGSPRQLANDGSLGGFFVGRDFAFDKEEMRFRVKSYE